MASRAPPQSSSSSTGSLTVTVDPSPLSSSLPPPQPSEAVVLRLTRRAKKVTWKEGTVDNEGLGRKSSKKCCIFHKEVPFDEDCSDDESPGGGGCSSFSHGHSHHDH